LIVSQEVEVGAMGVKALAMCANSLTHPRVKTLPILTNVGKDVCKILKRHGCHKSSIQKECPKNMFSLKFLPIL